MEQKRKSIAGRVFFILFALIWLILPDIIPGPVDDLVLLITSVINARG